MTSQLSAFARTIRISHSIFALPFAVASGLLAAPIAQVPLMTWVVLVGCIVAARAAAMGFNRIVDRSFDASNPRTRDREIPSGELQLRWAWAYTLLFAALFVAGCAWLGPLLLALCPFVIVALGGYSLLKRVSRASHFVLGLCLGLAPSGVWIAITQGYGWVPFWLSLSVATWVAGFDILYATQDVEFDRQVGLHSVPASIGIRSSLRLVALLHLLTVALWIALAMAADLGWSYLVGVAALAAMLGYEHFLVRPDDLSRVNEAFFVVNGAVSVLFLASVGAGIWWV